MIATVVFGRPAEYDPAVDSFVRVKAGELRKRLAEYARGSGSTDPVRIEVPLGGYWPAIEAGEVPSPVVDRRRYWVWWAGAAGAAAHVYWMAWPATSLVRFWEPLVRSGKLVLISLPVVPRYLASGIGTAEQRIWLKDDVVGMGAATGAAHLAAHLRFPGYRIKSGKDVRYSDLRSGPTVLLGGFSSEWTMQEMAGWRFRFEAKAPQRVIDVREPGREWVVEGSLPNGRATVDYAIVSRSQDSSTGQTFLALAGVTTFGTQAAAEFVLSEERLAELFAQAPKGWSGRNLQAVISMGVKDDTPGPPKLMASHFW